MITEYQKFRIPDHSGKNHIEAEVNWNDDDAINECKVIKLTFPDGNKSFVKREDLNQILFSIGNADDQKKLIPQKIQLVHWYESKVGVRATKDIKRGEQVVFPVKFSVPCTNKDVIGAAKKEKSHGIWTPDNKF
jgi:hypothetical protein